MNIFKILANGDGSINEANVSAFLGYLLDPKGNHGLGFEFVQAFLSQVLKEGEFFDWKKYEYEVFLEQAFRIEGQPKQIVDIVVVCYSVDKGDKKESFMNNFIENSKSIHKIFLIENKIKNALTKDQIKRQFEAASSVFGGNYLDCMLHSIYVTPDEEKFRHEFIQSGLQDCGAHLTWNLCLDTVDGGTSVDSMLASIISKHALGEIEPIDSYVLHTMKAFNQFIHSGFKSVREEEKARKNDGSYTARFIKLNETSKIYEKLSQLSERLKQHADICTGMTVCSPQVIAVPRDPKIPVRYRGVQLDVYAGYESRDKVSFFYTVNRDCNRSRGLLEKLARTLGLELKKPNDKYTSYCRTEDMQKTIPLADDEAIKSAFLSAIKRIDRVFDAD